MSAASVRAGSRNASWRTWSGGLAQVDAAHTLQAMRANVRRSLGRSIVLEMARKIIAGIAERQEVKQVQAIRAWVLSRFVFVKDPIGVELLETPNYQLARIARDGKVQGDCDDAAALTAALCMAIGIPCTFYAVALRAGDGFGHVFTVARPLDRTAGRRVAVELDVTRPREVPTLPHFARRLPLDV